LWKAGGRTIRRSTARVATRAPEPLNADQGGAAREILNAAAWLLRHQGYEATTTRAIAEKVGIKAGSIYHHFPSKDAIVEQVVNEGVRVVHRAVSAALEALPTDVDPRGRLEAAVKAHLLSSLQNSDYTSACIRAFAFLPAKLRKACRGERRRYEDLWRDIVLDAVKAGYIPDDVSLDAVRLMLLGAVNWAGEWYRPNRVPIEEIAASFATLAFGAGRRKNANGMKGRAIKEAKAASTKREQKLRI
jgi:AcrR family transcriptional regulator